MAHASRSPRPSPRTLDVGYWVAMVVPKATAPLRCYVGQVQAVDAQGVRVTLVDWLTGTADDFDLFVPWRNLESALIATPEHSLEYFARRAGEWQAAMEQEPSHSEALM
jgi:hypothetical protein